MKPLKISHSAVTSKALLRMADSIPGAWIGIRIAGLLLLLSGWKSTAVSRLFGLSRQAVVDWVEFLRKECNVELKPRQARNWLKRLGFVLKRPVHRYIQASNKGVARFRRGLKKNSTES